MNQLWKAQIVLLLAVGSMASTGRFAAASERAKSLRESLKEADRIVVEDVNRHLRETANADLHPFEIAGAEKIAKLVSQFNFNDAKSGFHCMCDGDFTVTFYKGKKWLGTLSYHHARSLRWNDKKWEGDSLFTPESAKAWREWFNAQGDARFEKQYQEFIKEANRRRAIHEKFLTLFPEQAAEIFAEASTSVVTAVPDDGAVPPGEKLSPAAKKLIALFPDKTKLGLAVANGLGELCLLDQQEGSWSMATSREQLALECVKNLNAAEFAAVLESQDDTILLGAARLFFFERLADVLPNDKRGPQAARLCEVVLRLDQSDNADNAIRALGRFPCAETTTLLERLAASEIVVKQSKSPYKDEPMPQAAACLLLARAGSNNVGKLIKKVEASPKLDKMDKAALQVARSFNGEGGILDKSVFEVSSYAVGFGALATLEKERTKAALDAIIEGGTEHPWAAVQEEAILTVQRMTGQKWCKDEKRERASWYCDEVQEWWNKNRESFQFPATNESK